MSGKSAVEGADDGVDRGEFDVGVAADAVEDAVAGHFDLDVAHGAGVGAGSEGVFGVIEDFDGREIGFREAIDERGDRAVAGAAEGVGLSADFEVGLDRDLLGAINGAEFREADGTGAGDEGFWNNSKISSGSSSVPFSSETVLTRRPSSFWRPLGSW